jgi:hypothetical protein
MRRLLSESTAEEFLHTAIPLLRSELDHPGKQYLLTLLLMNDLILTALADPVIFSFDEAIAIARNLVKTRPVLDLKLMRLYDSQTSQDQLGKRAGAGATVRLMEIIAAIPENSSILFQLLDHSDLKIRSKAALLAGRIKKNSKWVERRLADSDFRVRSNAVESLWGVESPGARDVLWAAVNDPDNRIAGNALLGLYRIGEDASIPLIVNLLSHADQKFRRTGVWLIGETRDPRFLPLLAQRICDPDPHTRGAVFRSLAKLRQAVRNVLSAEPQLMC